MTTTPDIRWNRCDIKTTGLLANVLAKQAAAEAGAFEALLHTPDGIVTEASVSNAWMVAADGTVVTHPLGPQILGGVTRARVLSLIREAGYVLAERPFTLDEATTARELFLTGTTTLVMPIVQVDAQIVADGRAGPVALDLRRRYRDYVARATATEAAWRA